MADGSVPEKPVPRLRWINDDYVDSAAMYQAWTRVPDLRNTVFWKTLWVEIHEGSNFDFEGLQPEGYSQRLCSRPREQCPRCRDNRGGFTFRWFHPLWGHDYVAMIRHSSAWKPTQEDLQITEAEISATKLPVNRDELPLAMAEVGERVGVVEPC